MYATFGACCLGNEFKPEVTDLVGRVKLAQPDVVISPRVLGGEPIAMVMSGEEVTPDFVMKHVFQRTADQANKGYCVANDLSERLFQLERSGTQWGKGKSAPGFCPLGPMLVTPDEVAPEGLRIRSWVNGEPRQDSSTSDMVFGVDQIVHDLSQYLVLEPGDVILTGTPEGVALSGRFAWLQAGDVVELEIGGLGRQRQAVVGGAVLERADSMRSRKAALPSAQGALDLVRRLMKLCRRKRLRRLEVAG